MKQLKVIGIMFLTIVLVMWIMKITNYKIPTWVSFLFIVAVMGVSIYQVEKSDSKREAIG